MFFPYSTSGNLFFQDERADLLIITDTYQIRFSAKDMPATEPVVFGKTGRSSWKGFGDLCKLWNREPWRCGSSGKNGFFDEGLWGQDGYPLRL
jgi:hypothetical protein